MSFKFRWNPGLLCLYDANKQPLTYAQPDSATVPRPPRRQFAFAGNARTVDNETQRFRRLIARPPQTM